ncbi:MAG: phosphodiesterase [Emcibacteraceae bacterium]|nr:phosphodiesterase [Emcibacteraceae bacterium]
MKEPIQYDPVTGLPDRAYLWSLLDDTLKQVLRNTSNAGVLLIQLNNMDDIKSRIGDEGTNEFLSLMASRIKKCLWDLDTAVQFENDRFVIVANSIHKQEDIHTVLKKVQDYLTIECEIMGKKISPSTAVGVVLLPVDTTEIDEVMSFAGSAVQIAASRGDNSYYYFNEEIGKIVEQQEVVKTSILSTLAEESFVLMLQPKIDINSRKICGVEALVRMRDSENNIISPDEFIPVAENSDLILKIGDWVLEKAQSINNGWKKAGINLPISINISDVQFKNGASLLASLHKLSRENADESFDLILEISENIITHDVTLASALMSEIKSYGYQISIDGFGSGFSSLSVLKDLKIDEIKIDRHFLDNVPSDEKNTAILKSIIMLGKSMDFRVVAMGVESEEQFEIIKSHDCDEFQGFLVSKPMVETDFLDWYKNYNG